MDFLYRLKRHPIPMAAWFQHTLVLTYALPSEALEPLIPPGLTLDTWGGLGFLAIALVDTKSLRPSAMPSACGWNSRLAGYRIFTRLAGSRSLRGLRILRSETDRWPVAWGGRLLTHYNYHRSRIDVSEEAGLLRWKIGTRGHLADLDVTADLTDVPCHPPNGSPFSTWREARRFAGPLPFTFDYEPETQSIIRIEGVRENWTPRPVDVVVSDCKFLDAFPGARLASAFYVSSIPYQWKRGVRQEVASCA
jgi:hypothetical protein